MVFLQRMPGISGTSWCGQIILIGIRGSGQRTLILNSSWKISWPEKTTSWKTGIFISTGMMKNRTLETKNRTLTLYNRTLQYRMDSLKKRSKIFSLYLTASASGSISEEPRLWKHFLWQRLRLQHWSAGCWIPAWSFRFPGMGKENIFSRTISDGHSLAVNNKRYCFQEIRLYESAAG